MIKNRSTLPICAGFATICAAIAAFLVQDRVCKISQSLVLSCLEHRKYQAILEGLQMTHYVAVFGGVVLIVMTYFYSIYSVDLLFNIAVVGNLSIFFMMCYGFSAMATEVYHPRASNSVLKCGSIGLKLKDTIEVNREAEIAIMVLDLLALCCSLIALVSSRHWIGLLDGKYLTSLMLWLQFGFILDELNGRRLPPTVA